MRYDFQIARSFVAGHFFVTKNHDAAAFGARRLEVISTP
jgi:hypothetical protein